MKELDGSTLPSGNREMSEARHRFALRWFLVVAYAIVGIIHLARADWFLPIMPYWVPYPHAVVLMTGMAELAGAAGLSGLAGRRLRAAAGIGLAVYAICVFPANIKHALDDLALV